MKPLPLIFYQTTLYWVDDDDFFLKIATDRFRKKYNIIASSSSKHALHYLNDYQSRIDSFQFLHGCDDHDTYDFANHLPIDLDFDRIRSTLKNKNREKEISVLIVDYKMPALSGIQLCEALSDTPAKKILLTGYADLEEAIDAFNKGIIHYFIAKDDPHIDEKLHKAINELTTAYFIEKTSPLLHHIEADSQLPQTDPVFFDFFNQLINEKDIIEYTLADKNGGMMLRDRHKKLFYLVIHTSKSLDYFVDLHSPNSDTAFFLKSVLDRKLIPFFGVGSEIWGVESIYWEKNFYKPECITGREKYYWAWVALHPSPMKG